MAPQDFQTIDEYIASFPKDTQVVLDEIRRTIKDAAPEAEEKISYKMPTFTLGGRRLIYFSAWKKHIGVYGASGALQAYKDDVAPYVGDKGSLRLPLDKPMPLTLIAKIVEFGVQEAAARTR